MFQRIKVNLILDAVITIVIGCVLLLWPGATMNLITRAIGILILLIGVVITANFFSERRNVILRSGSLVGGLIVAVIGVWVLVNPRFFEALIPFIAGVIIVFGGAVNLLQALSLWKDGYSRWWIALVVSLVTILLGVLLFTKPLQSLEAIVQVIGVFLLFDGVSDLWVDSRIIKLAKRAEAAVQEATAIDTEGSVVEEP